jgi:undecaprenyl-diphosphatase
VVLLAALTVQVVLDAGPLIPLDEAVRDGSRDLAAASALSWLDGPMHTVADLGGPVPAGIVLAVAYAFAARRKVRSGHRAAALRAAVVTALAVGVVSAAVILGKIAIARPGPDGGEVTGGEWGFFPSGHTATSSICYGAAALLLGAVVSARARRRWYAGTILLCGLVGFALLWCDYHWLGDVLASWALCGIVLALTARFLPVSPAAPPPACGPPPAPPGSSASSPR